MPGATQTVYKWQIPEWLGAAGVLVEHLLSQPIHGFISQDCRRVSGSGAVGLYPQVGRFAAHEGDHGQHDAATHASDKHARALPPEHLDNAAHQGGHDSRADSACSPEDAYPQPQVTPEPAAHRGHQGDHCQGLSQGQQHAEEQKELPDLRYLAQQKHADQVHDRSGKKHPTRAVAIAQPPGHRGVYGPKHVVAGNDYADGA